MNDRDMWWKIIVVGVMVALAFASIHPTDEKLKYEREYLANGKKQREEQKAKDAKK